MNRKNTNRNILFLFLIGFALHTHASMFRVQGRLTDKSGQPTKNATARLKFEIYDAAEGGVKIWPVGPQDGDGVVSNIPTSESGLFSTEIGPFSNTLFSMDKSYFLQIYVDDFGYQTLKPRQKLDTVPFAIQAGRADAVSNNSVGSSQIINGSIQAEDLSVNVIGSDQIKDGAIKARHLSTGTVNSDIIVDGGVATADLVDNAITPSKFDKEAFQSANLTFVPQGAIFMFLKQCPNGYTEVSELRNRVAMGADTLGTDGNIPNEFGKTGGSETHQHNINHTHTVSQSVKTGESIYIEPNNWWKSFDNDFNGYLIEKAAEGGDGSIGLTGHRHIHTLSNSGDLLSGQVNHLPPFLTVLFCKKD